MRNIVRSIIRKTVSEEIISVEKIEDFGTVNDVFKITCEKNNYVLRINDESKYTEYLKEKWCLENVAKANIPVPEVVRVGINHKKAFLLQKEIAGLNGKCLPLAEKNKLYYSLGRYAAIYQDIESIDCLEVKQEEFHADWRSRLSYNLGKLNWEDKLLQSNVINKKEQDQIKEILKELNTKQFNTGLVHGDLTPSNTIVENGKVFLLDWGTAEINIVPHSEVGILIYESSANSANISNFMDGMEISEDQYEKIKGEILRVQLLRRLDKYRWATAHDRKNLKGFADKVKDIYEQARLIL